MTHGDSIAWAERLVLYLRWGMITASDADLRAAALADEGHPEAAAIVRLAGESMRIEMPSLHNGNGLHTTEGGEG